MHVEAHAWNKDLPYHGHQCHKGYQISYFRQLSVQPAKTQRIDTGQYKIQQPKMI